NLIVGHHLGGKVWNFFMLCRNSLKRAGEHELPVVVVGSNLGLWLSRIGLALKRKLRTPPGKFPVAEARRQGDLAARLLGNFHAEVHGVGGAGRAQTHVYDGARGPGVALVDRVAVRVDLQRAVEVRSLFHRTFAVVLDHATPENRLALVVDAFKFEPSVVGIDGAAGKKMPDAFGAHHDIDANGIAATDGGLHAI